jgi:phosphoribosylformimino-5-aminoimidazole carboxamide ribotide isomerase
MPILPVVDLLKGRVVRGVAGRRHEYRPIVSTIAQTPEPLAVATALREHFGFVELYVADLDGIMSGRPALATHSKLIKHGFHLWLDAGVREATGAESLFDAGVDKVIVGLETVTGPRVLGELCGRFGAERVVFSLDLKDGQPLGATASWGGNDRWGIAQRAVGEGVRHLLVLDLARVGVGAGVGTEILCADLRSTYPALTILAGGGVRGPADIRRLYDHGVDYALVASALHDGRLARADVAQLAWIKSGKNNYSTP